MNQITLKRDELYNEVWSIPMSKLAQNYSISDVGLAKICKRMNIPIPYRGYWANKAAGKTAIKIPLPRETANTVKQYTLDSHELNDSVKEMINQSTNAQDSSSLKYIKVPPHFDEYHQLVDSAHKYFLSNKPNPKEPFIKSFGEMLEIDVSIENLERALRIIETIIRTLEQMGGQVEIGKHRYNESYFCTYAVVYGERIPFSLKEQLGFKKHIPTENEIKKQKKNQWDRPAESDPIPSGQFILEVETYTNKKGLQRRWIESPTQSLDDQLGKFIMGLIKTAPILKQERLEYEERQRIEFEEKERIRLEQEKKDAEYKRQAALNSHLEMYTKVETINKYLDDLQNLLQNENIPENQKEEINHWIEWVKNYQNKINPMNPKNLLYEHWVPEELYPQQGTQKSTEYNQWGQPKQNKEPSWGWWNRPPWKW